MSLLAILSLAALSRLPQLLGGNLFPDGDECLVGLMAKDWIDNGRFPLFFWGQAYGLSTLEAGAVALGFKFIHYAPLTIKVSMLPLWALGVWLQSLAIRRFAGERAAWIALLLMAACPAWAGWSMKARGGYLTAFILFGLVLWLIARSRSSRHLLRHAGAFALILGLLSALIFFAQAIWIPPLLPFLLLPLARSRRKWKDLAWFSFGAVLALVPLLWVISHQRNVYKPPLDGHFDLWHGLSALPERLFTHLTGAYFLYYDFLAPFGTRLAALVWIGLILFSVTFAVRQWRRRRSYSSTEASLLGLLATVFCTVPMNYVYYGNRYLLPLTGLLVIILSNQLSRAWTVNRHCKLGTGVLLLALAVLSGFSSAEWSYPLDMSPNLSLNVHQNEVDFIARQLLSRNIRHVYCLDTLLQYRLIFATHGRLRARSYGISKERQLQYPLAVEQARLTGAPTVLLGQLSRLEQFEKEAASHGTRLEGCLRCGPMLFALFNPPPKLLSALGVEILPNVPALQQFLHDQDGEKP